jgi:hypothetical protein
MRKKGVKNQELQIILDDKIAYQDMPEHFPMIHEEETINEEVIEPPSKEANLVKPYTAPNLDDDFLGEYTQGPDTLEPTNYTDVSVDILNKILLSASKDGDSSLVYSTLNRGANPMAINSEGKNCLDLAIEFKQDECRDIILNFLKDYNS